MKQFLAREEGQSCLEYAATIGLVVVMIIIVVCLFLLPIFMSGNISM